LSEILSQMYKGIYVKYSLFLLDSIIRKGISRQAEVALGFPSRLRPRIIMTFGTKRVVDRQPNAPAAFTP